MKPECPPPESVKEEIESTVRGIVGDKTDGLIEAMETKGEEVSFRDVLREHLTREEARQVGRAVHKIIQDGWDCDEDDEDDLPMEDFDDEIDPDFEVDLPMRQAGKPRPRPGAG